MQDFSKETKIAVVKAIKESGIPVGAVAKAMSNDEEELKKLRSMINNWLNSYDKAIKEGKEPFSGRGRRTAVYALNKEQSEAMEKIAAILLKHRK